jgi:hypothetical protein
MLVFKTSGLKSENAQNRLVGENVYQDNYDDVCSCTVSFAVLSENFWNVRIYTLSACGRLKLCLRYQKRFWRKEILEIAATN